MIIQKLISAIKKETKNTDNKTQKNTSTQSTKDSKPSLDEQFRSISKSSHIHLQEGSLGLYACDLYNLSEINRKEKDYDRQIHTLIISAYIHLSGIDRLEQYEYWKNGDFSITRPMPMLPPAVSRSTRICLKRLGMSLEQYRKLFLETVSPDMTPVHVFGAEKSLDIICTYLQGDQEKADKMITQGTKKFIKEYPGKGR